MIIRKVDINDLDAVTRLENICFPEAEAATKESFEYRIAAFPESFYVALENDEMIGIVNGCVTDSLVISDDLFEPGGGHNPNGRNQAIFGLLVDPRYQKRGIAANLMNYFMDAARQAGRDKMILTCKEHLIKYYEKFGYVNYGISKSTHGGAVWYDMVADL
jgi:ribosomal protein S18 acetylase RimI-like enzyme